MNYCNELSQVVSNQLIAKNTYRAVLSSPNIASAASPGQFVNILPSSDWRLAMRRPMSLAGVKGDNIELIYKVFGPGTDLMSKWKKGCKVDMIGPLGNFWNDFDKMPVLIGGGVGIAPIMYLSDYLKNKDINHYLIMGAKDKGEHFLNHNPDENVFLSTDNGSIGIKGNVLDVFKEINPINSQIKIFSCGPSVMMESLRDFSNENGICCDLALETVIACGFGICQGCTVEYDKSDKDKHSYRSKFGLVCLDGPIFNSKKIKTCKL